MERERLPHRLPANAKIEYGFDEDPNRRSRPTMEDAHKFVYGFGGMEHSFFAAIYDGHSGKSAADWCADHLDEILAEGMAELPSKPMAEQLHEAFLTVDSQLIPENGITSGCTAVVCVVIDKDGTRTLYMANVGDARAVLQRDDSALCLSVDHRPGVDHESSRVIAAGGSIVCNRVNVSRALGDEDLKQTVIGDPYTVELALKPTDKYLILACDGLWDVCSNEKAVELIGDMDDPQEAAEKLVRTAIENRTTDNVSVMVVKLTK